MTSHADTTRSRVPDILVERLVLGELDPQELERVRRALASEPGGEARLEALRADNRLLLSQFPARVMAARIRELSLHRKRRQFVSPKLIAVFAGLAASVGALWISSVLVPAGGETDRIKGLAPHVVVYRQTATGSERLADGATVGPGDIVQLGYVEAGEVACAIVAVDGSGKVSILAPEENQSLRHAAGEVVLPFGYQLDAIGDFEQFFLVSMPASAPTPCDPQALLGATRTHSGPLPLTQLPIRSDLRQYSMTLKKESP